MQKALLCCLLVVGCTGRPLGGPDGATDDDHPDMLGAADMTSVEPRDMATVEPADLTVPPDLTVAVDMTGLPDMTVVPISHTFPGFDDLVSAIVHNGSSYYVGGRFTRISSHWAPNILALDATGTPTPCPLGAGFDGTVEVIAQANGALYVGGEFTHYQGAPANGLAKIDATTCALDTAFSPPSSNGFNGIVEALAVAGSSLYVGGLFSAYRGVAGSANGIARLDLATGALDTTFSPAANNGFSGGSGSSQVLALAVAGSSLYVGGLFASYRGVANSANYVAKLDLVSGALDTTFSPASSNGFNSSVKSLAVAGSSLYVGGFFSAYRGVANSANGLAKLDLASGAIDTTFSPVGATSNGFSGTNVYALAASDTSLYVGGEFSVYQKGGHNVVANLAKLDLATGALDTAFNSVAGFNARVQSLALVDGWLYAGGQFTQDRIAPDDADHLARIDATSGTLDTTFIPSDSTANGLGYNSQVQTLVVAGSTLWAGGSFRIYGGTRVNYIAKLDDVTFALDTTFSPPGANGFSSWVDALAVSGSSLYAGGYFVGYRGVLYNANGVAKLDLVSGALDTTFSPPGAGNNGFANPYPGSMSVRALAVDGASLYVAGQFRDYRGVASSANDVAKLDLVSGAIDTTFSPPGATSNGFDPSTHADALAVAGGALYVGGSFTAYKGVTSSANRLAKLDLASGAIDTTFSPPGATSNGFDTANPYGSVYALTVAGSSLYVGGEFISYRGVANSANAIAKLDLASGDIDTTFSPPGANNNGFLPNSQYVAVLALTVAGGSLYAAGWELSGYRGVAGPGEMIAKLDLASGVLDTTFSPPGVRAIGVSDSVWSLAANGGTLLVGGDLTIHRGTSALANFALIDLATGALQ